jgi:hypothetical protein
MMWRLGVNAGSDGRIQPGACAKARRVGKAARTRRDAKQKRSSLCALVG